MAAALVLMCHDRLFLCGIAAASVHELGHIIAIILTEGTSVSRISVGALGIKMAAADANERPIIILAGVISNALICLLCIPLLYFERTRDLSVQMAAANTCLAMCNILPIEPLDGGTLLRYFLDRRLPPQSADRAVFAVSLAALIPLAAAALFAVMQSRGNFSLLILCLWLLAGILRRYL